MDEIRILPATPDRFADVEHTLTGGGDGRSCQCQWWTLTNAQFEQTDQPEREELLRREVDASTPGLIAYVDDDAAAWVRVGPRTAQPRLARTRNYATVSQEPWDDPTVWAVSCFVVRREHRGSGLNARLLDAAVDFAREQGARVVEGYPIDPHEGSKKPVNDLFHGVLSTFLAAGFHEVGRARPDRPVVALELS